MNRFVVVSGCSGGGKSTLLAELGRRGHAVIEEPGRRIVKEELESGGRALPWVNGPAFARRATTMALADRAAADARAGWVFFDRGLVDASGCSRPIRRWATRSRSCRRSAWPSVPISCWTRWRGSYFGGRVRTKASAASSSLLRSASSP
jgi:predicted ATPase